MSYFIVPALIFLFCVAIAYVGCRKSAPSLRVGGIYSIADGNGRYGVVKLLVHSDGICHVRVYKQKFPSRPCTVNIANLSLGTPGDPDGFGMGHIPLREAGFLLKWQPELITITTVTPDELEGYQYWKEESGGVF
jgi:hypothetical protein